MLNNMKKYLLLISLFILLFLSSCHININNENTSNIISSEITTSTTITTPNTTTTAPAEIEFKKPFGTWWWNKNLDVDTYFNFAKDNDITEIYFCDYNLDGKIDDLLEKSSKNNINVYLLAGEKEWLNDRSGLDSVIETYINYNDNHDNKLSGIHLDIEPHQFKDFSDNRDTYLYKLIDLIKINKEKYNNIIFQYDIPFWLHDIITYNNQEKEAYKHIIDYADMTFIMSYRDTSDKMITVSIDEINYAKENNKILFLSAETYSEEGDQVSYMEEGKNYMYDELNKLRLSIPDNFGIAIHHIKSWYELDD